MNEVVKTLKRFARVISRSTRQLSSWVATIWQTHQEFMSENPSYRELFDLVITTGIRLLRMTPALAIAISAVTATLTERNHAWE